MIEQIVSLKQRGSSAWRLRQGNTQRREGGHISRNHKLYFGGGFYTFVSFKSRDKDFTEIPPRGSLHCKNRRHGGNLVSPMLIIINFWTTQDSQMGTSRSGSPRDSRSHSAVPLKHMCSWGLYTRPPVLTKCIHFPQAAITEYNPGGLKQQKFILP